MKLYQFIIPFCICLFGCLEAKKSPFDINNPSSPVGAFAVNFATNSGNASTSVSSESIAYSQSSIVITRDIAMAEQKPTIVGKVSGFTAIPALPTGIAINATTGVISGTPTANQAETSYQVSANGSNTTLTTEIKITINSSPPSSISYNGASSGTATGSTPTALLFRRTQDASVTPTLSGSGTFAITPALPAGLSINSTSGVISGTPSVSQVAGNYTVTVTNQFGNGTVTFTIAVLPVIYAATFGGGLAISTDGGNSFVMRTVVGGVNNLDSVSVCSDGTILINERNNGIYKSTDNGFTFSLIQSFQSHYVFCNPSNPSIIYSASNGFANPLYRSTDGGANFIRLTYGSNYITGMSYSNSFVYTSGQTSGVYRSSDGVNFNFTIAPPASINDIFATSAKVYATQGNTVQVSVNNGTSFSLLSNISSANKVAASANDVNIYVGTTGSGLHVSNDSGSTFNAKTTANGLLSNSIQTVFLDINGVIYAGSSDGMSVSTDGGNTFVTKNNGLTNLSIQKIIVH